MPIIETVADERIFKTYLDRRSDVLVKLVGGVYANIDVTDRAYDELTVSLTGGSEAQPDLSAWAEYHASVTASVAPFVAAIRASMDVIHDSMQVTNTLAVASDSSPIYAIEDDAVTVQQYVVTLQTAIATLQATAQAIQQLGGGQ